VPGPRVRFAPSPTGFFHVGSARTSLFNWLYARQQGGTFVLRIEDTDVERGREEWKQGIITAMEWLGLHADEGPYLQSELAPDHATAVDALWANGHLYACDCTREEVEARSSARGRPGYDGRCRERGLARDAGALRFRVPATGETVVHDLIRGDVVFPHDAFDDFVVVRSSGVVLYTLANLVDDRMINITHVIRGEDLLPTTPKQVLMWEALNACAGIDDVPLPRYAHLPMLVNEQRKKLSKRRDPVAVESYRDQGYLPDAFVNYLALLGWSPKDGPETMTRDRMVAEFRLEDVSHSPAFFDVKKLTHLNGEYVRALSAAGFLEAVAPWVAPSGATWRPPSAPPWPPESFDADLFARIAPLVQERVATLGEVPGLVAFLFLDEVDLDESAVAALRGAGAEVLADLAARLIDVTWTADELKAVCAAVGDARGLKLRQTQAPLRLAVTGASVGLPLFESMELLGRERVLARVERALARVRG
jgi:glutamyl-tRNA synthetase